MELKKLRLIDIKPYDKNPRKNDDAVESVAESIRQCGYVAPIIVDEDYVILAGHTRYKALHKLGIDSVECVIKTGLTEEQKRKYRILDNKTGEIAKWDTDLLSLELDGLDFDGFDFGFDFSIVEVSHDLTTVASVNDETPQSVSADASQPEAREESTVDENEYDFSDIEEESNRMSGMEDVSINIVVPKKHEAVVREFLKNGEADTAPGRGVGVMKRCGLL